MLLHKLQNKLSLCWMNYDVGKNVNILCNNKKYDGTIESMRIKKKLTPRHAN